MLIMGVIGLYIYLYILYIFTVSYTRELTGVNPASHVLGFKTFYTNYEFRKPINKLSHLLRMNARVFSGKGYADWSLQTRHLSPKFTSSQVR